MDIRTEIFPNKIEIMEKNRIRIELYAPKEGVKVGGGFYFPFYLKAWEGLLDGLDENGLNNRLVKVYRSDGKEVEVENIINNHDFYILNDLEIKIENKNLNYGEKIIVEFGTVENKVFVLRKQKCLKIECKIKLDNKSNYIDIELPKFKIKNGEAEKLFAVVPSIGEINSKQKLIIYAEDINGNVCEDYNNDLEITINKDKYKYTMKNWDENKLHNRNEFEFTTKEEGVYYVSVRDKKLNLLAESNPILIKNQVDKKIYWGDLHVHSQISDGRGELDDLYRDAYARGLDFISVADHSFGRDSRGDLAQRISHQCNKAEEYLLKDKFIPIAAGETHYLDINHLNLYFKKNNPDLINRIVKNLNTITKDISDWNILSKENKQNYIDEFWTYLSSNEIYPNVLAFFHHTMWLGKKEYFHESMRLIEICSIFGSSECRDQSENSEKLKVMKERLEYGDEKEKTSVIEALDMNYKLGFVGGSDNHDGQAGKNAITAVYAEKLNYENIYDALYNRRCYATNANKTIIDVKMEKDSQNSLSVKGLIAGDGEIDKYEIIHNGAVLIQQLVNKKTVKFAEIIENAKKGYYYIRVMLKNGDGAWLSPIWLN